MTTYKIQAPDGNTYQIDGPAGASQQDVQTEVMRQHPYAGATTQQKIIGSVPARVAAGMADPLVGANALYDKAVGRTGQFLTSGAGYFPNPVSDWLGKAAESGQTLSNQETQAINTSRQALGTKPGSTDWARLTGNVLSPANAAFAPAEGAGLAEMAGSGAMMGASQPVDTSKGQDYTRGVLANTLAGGATSGVVGGGLRALGSAATPAALSADASPEVLRRAAQVQALRDAGIEPSLGQSLGGAAQTFEEKASSIPVVGDIIKRATQQRPTEDLNRSLYNSVLNHIGEVMPTDVAIGRPALEHVNDAVGNAYDDVLGRMQVNRQGLQGLMQDVQQGATTLPQDRQAQLSGWVNRVNDAADQNGTISGQAMKGITSDLRKTALDYSTDQSADVRGLGQSLFQLHNNLMQGVRSFNPDAAIDLENTDRAYSELMTLNKAASKVGATDGVITPAQYANALITGPKGRVAAKASGTLNNQDLADAAKVVLSPKTANSYTADRSLLAAALLGGVTHPMATLAAAAPTAAVYAAYSRPGQRFLANALTGPDLGQALQNFAPQAGSYATRGATGLFRQQ